MAKKALLTKSDKEKLANQLGLSSIDELHEFNAEVIALLNPMSVSRQKLDAINKILGRISPSDIK